MNTDADGSVARRIPTTKRIPERLETTESGVPKGNRYTDLTLQSAIRHRLGPSLSQWSQEVEQSRLHGDQDVPKTVEKM